jgi:hypothetical protein
MKTNMELDAERSEEFSLRRAKLDESASETVLMIGI